MSPMYNMETSQIDLPEIIIAHDNSQSLLLNKANNSDSLAEYKKQLEKFIAQLSEKFTVRQYTFGNKILNNANLTFTETSTNISDVFSMMENNYFNKNVGALIVASDGVYNGGQNPVYTSKNLVYPLYTIALGDTTRYRDAAITKVRTNQLAFLGNQFPVEINISANQLQGQTATIEILHNNTVVFSSQVFVNKHDFGTQLIAYIKADKTGVQKYRINIKPLNGEITLINNTKDIVIDVIDSKQKILILANAPHPDIAAIRNALIQNENFEIDVFMADNFTKMVTDYNVVILCQLPSLTRQITPIISSLLNNNIPTLYVGGMQLAVPLFNNIGTGINIGQFTGMFSEVQAQYNQAFNLFEVAAETQSFFNTVPPLQVPYADYKISGNVNVLFTQKIKGISTSKSLITIQNDNAGIKARTAFIAGEGIWKWRIENYKQEGNFVFFDALVSKLIQFLALKIVKEPFVVQTKKIFSENEAIYFDAQVYNKAYELVTEADVNLLITDSVKRQYAYVFNKGSQSYYLRAGIFPAGDYMYEARTTSGDVTLTKSGKFTVSQLNLETENLIANHQLLNQIAIQNNGKMYYESELDKLAEAILQNNTISPVMYTTNKLIDFVSFKWLFFIILLLLATEWILRKYWGTY